MGYESRECVQTICLLVQVGILCMLSVEGFMVPHQHEEAERRNSPGSLLPPQYAAHANLNSALFDINSHLHKNTQKGDVSQCSNVPIKSRSECGYSGVSRDSCESRGCCWQKNILPGIPWCFHKHGHVVDKCDMQEWQRKECGQRVTTPDHCLREGCCWQPSDNVDTPWCFETRGQL